ncbi:hypothetical protein ASG30_13980 [Ramlibacter sp. Leaf400]|nr:hypothetical protein ASG30_13980 [Ramlibacter sp. Leaf400]
MWIASVVAVAACAPGDDDPDSNTAPAASTRPQASPQAGRTPVGTAPLQRTQDRAQAGDPAAVLGAAPGTMRNDDSQITAKVRAELAAATDLGGARIDVDTRDGVVTLSGPVRTAAVKARASEIARQVRDVRDVNDQLTLVMS